MTSRDDRPDPTPDDETLRPVGDRGILDLLISQQRLSEEQASDLEQACTVNHRRMTDELLASGIVTSDEMPTLIAELAEVEQWQQEADPAGAGARDRESPGGESFGRYVLDLPEDLRKRIIFIQTAEGSTGDGYGYKGDPLVAEYAISREEWGGVRIETWDVYRRMTAGEAP